MKVILAGIGMGNAQTLTGEALSAIKGADALVGAKRMLESALTLFEGENAPQLIDAIAPSKIVAALSELPADFTVTVLCSGDTGFFSLATSVRKSLAELDPAPEVVTLCGITTSQYLAAAAGMPWQGAKLASAHGRDCDVLGNILANEKVFFLTGGDQTPATIIDMLVAKGMGDLCTVTVGERLSYDDQKVTRGTAADLQGTEFDVLSAMFVEHGPLACEEVRAFVGFSAIPDECFTRGGAPMTKQDVRALVTSRARLNPGSVAWDVGAGTGSISIEMACMQPQARIIAVEYDAEACELERLNRVRFGAFNMEVIEGRAPQMLEGQPAPDLVFIGGSTGELESIVECALEANPACRLIITAVTIETIAQTGEVLSKLAQEGRVADYASTQIASAHSKKLGGYHLMRPESPIFIFETQGLG